MPGQVRDFASSANNRISVWLSCLHLGGKTLYRQFSVPFSGCRAVKKAATSAGPAIRNLLKEILGKAKPAVSPKVCPLAVWRKENKLEYPLPAWPFCHLLKWSLGSWLSQLTSKYRWRSLICSRRGMKLMKLRWELGSVHFKCTPFDPFGTSAE